MEVLVIGGAGFIGSHLVDALVSCGFDTRIVDNLDPRVHPEGAPPCYLNQDAEFVQQDIRDREGFRRSLEGAEAAFYLAGAVGVGDSMYRIRSYVEQNIMGAANFLDVLANEKHSVRKVVLASSVTVYGEGKYFCSAHGVVYPKTRSLEQISRQAWEPHCPIATGGSRCTASLASLATDEEKPSTPLSIYASTKRTQEEMFLALGRAYGFGVTVLRYFNVYGPRQALSNPYTGVAKIFALQASKGEIPLIYEDGRQSRDFVHVSDVVRASLLALTSEEANGEIFNVGSGRRTSVLEVAEAITRWFQCEGSLSPSNRCRAGDVRHCWADITKIRTRLGFEPQMIFPAGIEDLLSLLGVERAEVGAYEVHKDLAERGLIA